MITRTKNIACIAFFSMLLFSCRQLPFETQILSYEGNKVNKTFVFVNDTLSGDGAGKWKVDVETKKVFKEAVDYTLTFKMNEGEMASGGAAVQFTFGNWDTENYVFAPCHVYGGNRFRIKAIGYPPVLNDPADRPLDMPITTTNIPHLSRDGSDSFIDFRTNSCATPIAGFYDKNTKKGFFILTEQDTILGDKAFFIYEYPSEKRLTIRLSAPGVREHHYVMNNADKASDDRGIALKGGDEIKMHFRVYEFPCQDLMAYFDKFLTIRKDLSGQNEFRNLEPFSSITELIYKHHFEDKWYEDENCGYYCNNGLGESHYGHLQLGWNGVPVYLLGQMLRPECQQNYDETLRRICLSFDTIEKMQGKSGLFYAILKRGELLGDTFGNAANEPNISMIRRTALTIYYGLQTLEALRLQGHEDMIKPSWEEMLHRASDALITLYNRYGEFGQLIYADSGEIHTPNSTQGALCVGALAYASKYFNEPRFLDMARTTADFFYDKFLSKGYVGGGPAEILQAPDSESSAELVESYVALYEITRDEKWMQYARDAAALFSSWVVSYDYKFPEGSGMARMNIKATGSVWASIQNEHSAPGIYIMSGDFLLKLYRCTGDKRYLDLDQDISHNVVQYVNTEGNRLQAHGGFGYCTERVNIGDWEYNIGWLADNDSNQAWENVTLFHTMQNPGIYVRPDVGEITVFDHVNARIVSSDKESVTLEVENPTYRDGDVSILAETSKFAGNHSLGWNAYFDWPKIHVPSGQKVTVTLPYAK